MKYDHKRIEKKWQEVWEKSGIYATQDSVDGPSSAKASAGKKENFYLLVEFPYPSGNLHVGHWYAFAEPDILARYMRMRGKNVLYPIGFDAFGLPAENAAIKRGLNPREWTEGNIEHMKKQIRSMGTSFDWSREVSTIDPAYYKWTQWLFIQLYKKGLVYQKETAVNWCPSCKTVLANEQVVDGACERCGTEVVQRQMLQWNIKITEYADRLIDDLAELDWPEQIKESQRNWIGRSEGAEIDFPLELTDSVKRIVILHAKGASPDSDFYRWLEDELVKRGYEVELPTLPNAEEPNDVEQTKHVLDNCDIDESTAIVGHSFGCIVALRLLECGEKAGRVVLVSPGYFGEFLDGKARPTVTNALKKGFDFETIGKNCSSFTVLHDVNDPIIPEKDADVIVEKLGAHLMKVAANGTHFNSPREPDVLLATTPTIRVFTTRPDTLFGATYLVLAPEHPFVTQYLQEPTSQTCGNKEEVQKYVDAAAKKSDLERQENKEKTGVKFEGVSAVNPATGEKIPLFVADYVLGHYGTGAIMAVPAHDERDHAFAKKFDVPVKEVVEPLVVRKSGPDAFKETEQPEERTAAMALVKHWSEEKYLCLRWNHSDVHGFVTGGVEEGEEASETARREIAEETGYTSAELVKPMGGRVHVKFFAAVKKVNRFAHFTPFLFQLKNDSRIEVEERERNLHEPVWIPSQEVRNYLNREDFKLIWDRVSEEQVYAGEGILVNSGEFDGLTTEEAKEKMTEAFGRAKKTYKLRDWIVSRQRYWGVPIPIVHCEKCGAQPVPEDRLPVELPKVDDYLPEGTGKSPLAKVKDFVETTCPSCGGKAQRETDTLDTFVDSSWYFLRYLDPHNSEQFAENSKQKKWMPVDLYSGGAEHTTMHLLYSRFWHKALFDMGLVGDAEPYKRRMNRSLIMGPDGQKMSKSRGNVVDPDEAVERLGADTVRMYLAFIGPYNEVSSYPWDPNGVVGVRRFLERLGRAEEYVQEVENENLRGELHRTIKKVGEDIAAMKFNTAISQMMILLNALEKEKKIGKEQWSALVRIVAPFAPHMAEELWQKYGSQTAVSVHLTNWPEYDDKYLQEETVTVAIQIDGKMRGTVEVPRDADKEALEHAAKEAVHEKLEAREVVKVIVVPGRLVNFVTAK
jgi:leucyl-tRNA synthetase